MTPFMVLGAIVGAAYGWRAYEGSIAQGRGNPRWQNLVIGAIVGLVAASFVEALIAYVNTEYAFGQGA